MNRAPEHFKNKANNLPAHLRRAAQALKEDADIIIKPSDKNLGLTILNKTWYNQEMNKKLNYERVYKNIFGCRK